MTITLLMKQFNGGTLANGDSFCCIDILDENLQMLYRAIECGDYLHSYSPSTLNLAPGLYHWRVWSGPSGSYGGVGFEGGFSVSE